MPKFHCYGDPQHAWLKVPRAVVREIGIADKVSGYSYQRGAFVYLEEDCDLTLFVNAHTAPFSIVEHHTNRSSRIRGYARYSPAAE